VSSSLPKRLLLIDDDESILPLLALLLEEEGFQVTTVADLALAHEEMEQTTFALILSDLYGPTAHPDIPALLRLITTSAPTPTGIMTARRLGTFVPPHEIALLLQKPFDTQELLDQIRAILAQECTDAGDAQTTTVQRFFAALNAHNVEQQMALCTNDVLYLPSQLFEANPLYGKLALRLEAEQRLKEVPTLEVKQVHIYPHAKGRVARFTVAYTDASGNPVTVSTAGMFQFRDGLLSQVGMYRLRGAPSGA
jgi:CheY-like chemotaxis protein